MSRTKILVTAANGHTGFPAARELLDLGFEVRAMVRNPDAANARELARRGAEIFVGDMDDVRDYRAALQGVRRAYFCAPLDRNMLFKTVAFVVAAEEARLEHVVYMSQWLLMQDHHALNTKEQWLADRVIQMHEHVAYSFVIPGIFAFPYFFTIEMVAQLGIMPTRVKGPGLNPIPSEDDMGRVVAHILKDPDKHAGRTYRPTGPKILSQNDVAQTFARILKRPVRIMHIDERMLLKSLKAMGYRQYDYANIRYYMQDLEDNAFAAGGVTDVVESISGRAPEDFETIARRYLADMPEARRSFRNKLRALGNFARILLTPAPNMEAYERRQQFPGFLNGMRYSRDSPEWERSRRHGGYREAG